MIEGKHCKKKKKKENHNQGLLSSSPKEISYNGFIYKAT